MHSSQEINGQRNYRPTQYNTNLEQISDWLTKSLVVVSLIEGNTLIEALKTYAKVMSSIFANRSASVPFAISLLLFNLIAGFLVGYLKTRAFFTFDVNQQQAGNGISKVTLIENTQKELKTTLPEKDNVNTIYDLSSFANQYIRQEDHNGQFFGSATSNYIYEIIRSETHTEPLLATIFWQILLRDQSNYLNNLLRQNGVLFQATMRVRHPLQRC